MTIIMIMMMTIEIIESNQWWRTMDSREPHSVNKSYSSALWMVNWIHFKVFKVTCLVEIHSSSGKVCKNIYYSNLRPSMLAYYHVIRALYFSFSSKLKYNIKNISKWKFNLFTHKIKLLIVLNVCHTILFLIWRIWDVIN